MRAVTGSGQSAACQADVAARTGWPINCSRVCALCTPGRKRLRARAVLCVREATNERRWATPRLADTPPLARRLRAVL